MSRLLFFFFFNAALSHHFQKSVCVDEHAHTDFTFSPSAVLMTRSLSLWAGLWGLTKNEVVQVSVCLVCNIHFPVAVGSLIRLALSLI